MVFYIIFNLKFIIKMETLNKGLEAIYFNSIKEVVIEDSLLYLTIMTDFLDNNEKTIKCKEFTNLVNENLKKKINIKLDSEFIIDICKKNRETLSIIILKNNLDKIGYKLPF